MTKEIAPIEAIRNGSPKQKEYYLRKALWSRAGFGKAKDKIREDDLIFWLGGEMPHLYRAKCNSEDEAREVVERFRDGFLPDGDGIEYGICLEGMRLVVTDKDLNILSDITIDENEIAKGMTKDGIRLVCEGELFDPEPPCDGQVEVVLERIGELATWSWTMHTQGKIDLSALELQYKTYRDQQGCRHSMIVSHFYGKAEDEPENHQWACVHSRRYSVKPALSSSSSDALLHKSDVELRIVIDGGDGYCYLKMRAWRGSESFPVCEIAKNPKTYEKQYEKFCDFIKAWHGDPDEFLDDVFDWEMDLGVFGYEAVIALKEELSRYEIRDCRSEEVLDREVQFQKVRCSMWNSADEVLEAAGWKPSDGDDAAIGIVARHCGVREEIARYAFDEGVWEIP